MTAAQARNNSRPHLPMAQLPLGSSLQLADMERPRWSPPVQHEPHMPQNPVLEQRMPDDTDYEGTVVAMAPLTMRRTGAASSSGGSGDGASGVRTIAMRATNSASFAAAATSNNLQTRHVYAAEHALRLDMRGEPGTSTSGGTAGGFGRSGIGDGRSFTNMTVAELWALQQQLVGLTAQSRAIRAHVQATLRTIRSQPQANAAHSSSPAQAAAPPTDSALWRDELRHRFLKAAQRGSHSRSSEKRSELPPWY